MAIIHISEAEATKDLAGLLAKVRAGEEVFPYTLKVAELAGRIDGEQTMKGNIIPFIDLLIGATAQSFDIQSYYKRASFPPYPRLAGRRILIS